MQNKPLPNIHKANLIDTHCHLDMDAYTDDLQDILEQATLAGIKHIISIGIDIESSKSAIKLAQKHHNISATIGIHPHDVSNITNTTYNELRALHETEHEYIVAYGEIGLDYARNYSPKDTQITHFRKQLELSLELQLPVIIHCRDAHKDLIDILKKTSPGTYKGVIHCFSGDCCFAERVLDLGFYISIPGIVTFKNAKSLHEVAKTIPLDKLLIETDGPFLSPTPFRGKRNQPAYLTYTANKIAELRNISFEEVAIASTANAEKLFSIG
ncbi:MAG: TatD family hydrolase [Desulfotalea sp.]